MKKLIAIVLCCMLTLSVLCTVTFAVDAQSNEIDVKTLAELGFSPPNESLFDKNSINAGSHSVQTFHEVVVDMSNGVANSSDMPYTLTGYSRKATSPDSIKSNLKNGDINSFSNMDTFSYTVSETFDPKGIGRDNYIARIGFSATCEKTKDAYIHLQVFNGDTKAALFADGGDVTGLKAGGFKVGRIYTQIKYEMWGIDGYLSISSGDYDGDGKDELAIYSPDNIDESNGNGPCKLRIWICDIDFTAEPGSNESYTMTKKELDLAVSPDGRHCEWQWSADNSTYTFYSIPYVAMHSEDVNDDGICDLLATVNFANNSRGTLSNTTYTRSQALDWNSRFASTLEVWEGVKEGTPNHAVVHRTLVAIDPNDSNIAYALRNANITVGDVTSYGSKQIIIGGNYTQLNYSNTNAVTSTRNVTLYKGDASVAKNVLGYTSYDNLKKNATTAVNSGYTWIQDNGYGDLHYYNSDKVNEPVSLGAFRAFGDGDLDTIFIAGRMFKYDANENKLKYQKSMEDTWGSDIDSKGRSNVWLGQCVVGNVSSDVFGRETLYVPMLFKKSGESVYRTEIYSLYGNYNGDSVQYAAGKTMALNNSKSLFHFSIAMGDFNNDSPIITYKNGDTDVYYSKLNILSILQAPPIYKELDVLNGEYSGNSETSFAKSKGSSTEVTNGGSITAGVVAGFEQETSFLGLFKCAGAEYELKVTGSVGGEKSTEKTVDYSTGYTITGANDAAVIFTVPYVRYNCMMYTPEYTAPSQSEYDNKLAFYNALKTALEEYEKTSAAQTNSAYQAGCPEYSYKYTATVNANNYAQQLITLSSVEEDLNVIRKSIKQLGEGGSLDWGQTVAGQTLPYHYCVPQTPMVTTVSVDTYDSIVAAMPGYDKISDAVFGKSYVPGDPSTYAHNISDLNVSSNLLYDTTGTSASADGFLTSSNISSGASSQSQSITVSKSEGKAVTYGAAVEATATANLAGVKAGFTMCAEYNGSTAWTTTEGNEYSATIANLPDGTPGDYTYGWRLVAYNTKINGCQVPVVGYLTKITNVPPKSVAQNFSVENVTDNSVTLSWEDGNRKADHYNLYTVFLRQGNHQEVLIASNIKSDENGICTYTVDNLLASSDSVYLVRACSNSGAESVATEELAVTTLPSGTSTSLKIDGLLDNVVYRLNKNITLNSFVDGDKGIYIFYQWQLNDGENGWVDMKDYTAPSVNFTTTAQLNNYKIRCIATIMASQSTSYNVYSNALVIRCSDSCDDYSIDWTTNPNKVTVHFADDAKDKRVYIGAYDDSNRLVKSKTSVANSKNTATIDLSDIDNGNLIKLFVWTKDMQPSSYVFVK